MSAERDALESAQAQLKNLEAHPITDDQLLLLADALDREAQTYEHVLEKGERRALARETTGPAARLMTFGFALLFVAPIVAMVGFSAAKLLKQQPEGAVAMLCAGALLIAVTLFGRARRAVAHLVSSEWRFVASARKSAAVLRSFPSPLGEGQGEGRNS